MHTPFYKRRGVRIGAAVTAAVIALAVAVLVTLDLAPFIAGRASAALDKPVSIGSAKLDLLPRPRVVMQDVKVGTVDDSGRADFADAQSLRVSVSFWRLLTGDLVFPEVHVANAQFTLERDAEGNVNWQSSDEGPATDLDPPQIPEIHNLDIKDTVVVYRDAMITTDLTLHVETEEPGGGAEPILHVSGKGFYQSQPAKIDMRGGSILTLRDTAAPYPIDGTFIAGGTEITVKGTVTDPVHLAGLNIQLQIQGDDAAELYPLFGIAIFPTPPYTLNTRLDRAGDRWILTDMTGTMGESDLSGALTWDISGDVPRMEGELRANSLALRDMAGFIGAAPGTAETPVEVRQEAAARERERRARMGQNADVPTELAIPDRTMSFEKLNSMNAKVTLSADKVVTKGFPIDRLFVDLTLEDGVLTLHPLDFNVENGKLGMNITVNSRSEPFATDVDVTVDRFPLQRLLGEVHPSLETSGTSWGAIGGRIQLKGTGNSMHEIFATSEGNVALLAEDGQISLLLIELMDIDLAEALGIILTKDQPVPIRCMVADFEVDEGLMTSRSLIVDTTDTLVVGEGTVDLGREVFDLKLNPKPKDASLAALRAPILIKGSFADPTITPEPESLAARGGAAVALGIILTPLAALLPLIEIGTGKDMNCAALIQSTENTAATPPDQPRPR